MAKVAAKAVSLARAARSEESRSKARIRRLRQETARLEEEVRLTITPPTWVRGQLALTIWNTVAEPFWRVAKAESLKELERRQQALTIRVTTETALHARRRTESRKITEAARSASETAKMVASLGPSMPKPLVEKGNVALRRAETATRRGRKGAGDFIAALHELEAVAEEWVQARRNEALRNSPTQTTKVRRPPDATVQERVYLPIPYAIGKYAQQIGARYDRDAPPGSKWYVPPDTPLGPFEPFLPLSFRETPPRLTFPPVRHGASSQNLWSVFDRESWNRIRHINYERTGRRCVLCGKQSGSLLRALDPENIRREGSVDCHEVWNWTVPEPGISLGIQRLKGMLTLCAECHATFHDGWARGVARQRGIEDEVRRFLMKRRSFLTRTHPVEVARQMQNEATRLREHSNIALWILDLTRLGKQDYMSHVQPVFMEENAAGVSPGQVAGISFVTDKGEVWPARTAREVYESLSDLYSHSPPLLSRGA